MAYSAASNQPRQRFAVIGSGISGMSTAWLLSHRHDVTLYESGNRLGGHANTVEVIAKSGSTAIDTGFIVFNERTYPNLLALFEHLQVETKSTDMSFGVSLNGGKTEYSSVGASAFLRGGRNLVSPRFWAMTFDLLRFYRHAPADLPELRADMISLGDYLTQRGYGEAFQRDHLLPQAAAIWSASLAEIREYPACAFVHFFENHGLLQLAGRPIWRTVEGGARAYVAKLTAPYADRIRLNSAVSVRRDGAGAWVRNGDSAAERFDAVVIATHADSAVAMLADASAQERELLGAFRYSKNTAVLHTDESLMPRNRKAWASWNYVGDNPDGGCVVSYWMNLLQGLACDEQMFLTLNPVRCPRADTIIYKTEYEHPLFDLAALSAQRRLWSLQGARRTWFCGAHFGAGFHEDGLQAGLAVAEQLGGVKRPWKVADESGRIYLASPPGPEAARAA
jgi:uncharacterized protein